MTVHIDTLSIARDLKATELPAEQAEAIAAAIGRSVTDGAASKADFQLLRGDFQVLRADFQVLRADLQASEERLTARIEAASRQTLVWLAGAIFAVAGILIATIKL